MGAGKTEAAITYMNEHKEKKFIYVTPYLAESNRIKEGCLELHFVEPSNKLGEYHLEKLSTRRLSLKRGAILPLLMWLSRATPERPWLR